ncbi:MAG: ion transporter [Bacteroidota bacterium]|nr:ion transporter [Bacteroidota bacterium]
MTNTKQTFKEKAYEIVFEADTVTGKLFDIILLATISLSVLLVILESVPSIQKVAGSYFLIAEWIITIVFSLEYILRIYIVKKKNKYIFSFYGLIDLLSVLPLYLNILFPFAHGLSVIRSLRLLRIFRILKLSRYVSESQTIIKALIAAKHKIGVFFFSIIMIVIILGTVMYIIETEESGFETIPQSIYWAIVTLTTVGYGDIAPITPLGQAVSSVIMILGYAIIAVPTGIVTSEFNKFNNDDNKITTQVCPNCLKEGHEPEAVFCKYCGAKLNP